MLAFGRASMQIHLPSVGPIVGATNADSSRIFLRGDLDLSGGQPRRAHGVLRLRKSGGEVFSKAKYFQLNPNFDMTGVCVCEGLAPETPYEYQVGWIHSELDSKRLDLESVLDWQGVVVHQFVTGSASAERSRTFVFGSCRYLLRLFGGSWFDTRGDKTFGSVLRQIREGRAVDAFLMVGDQIYADDLRTIGADRAIDAFFQRYREAFTTENLRALMAQVPTYMTLDDHEVEDGWPARATRSDYIAKFPSAIHAYQTYQLSHSPVFDVVEGRLSGTLERLWYTFSDGCAEFFVADTRTERRLDPGERAMLGAEQERALLDWLADGSPRVKFLVSSVPLFAAEGEDTWEGFRDQRDQLLDFICERRIRRVVVLSGDVHASFSAELRSRRDPAFQIVSVVSSAFFWPYPHPPRSRFQAEGSIVSKSANGYYLAQRTDVYATDNFVRLTCSPSELGVEVFERKGRLLGRSHYSY